LLKLRRSATGLRTTKQDAKQTGKRSAAGRVRTGSEAAGRVVYAPIRRQDVLEAMGLESHDD
jgi:hypothetical protein